MMRYLFIYVCSLVAACTCRTGAIRRGAPEVHLGACGPAPLPEACTRAARRGASDPVRIRSCVTPAGRPAWTARAPTTRDRVASACCIPYSKMYYSWPVYMSSLFDSKNTIFFWS